MLRRLHCGAEGIERAADVYADRTGCADEGLCRSRQARQRERVEDGIDEQNVYVYDDRRRARPTSQCPLRRGRR